MYKRNNEHISNITSRVLIAGGGIIGLYSAYILTKKAADMPITVIDQGAIGAQCSSAAGGILSPLLPWDYPDTIFEYLPVVNETYASLALHLREDMHADIEFHIPGMRVFASVNNLKTGQAWCQQHNINVHADDSSLYLPDIAQLNPAALVQALRKKLLQTGVELLENTQVKKCHVKAKRLIGIDTSQGYIACDKLIWTTGAWANALSQQQGNIYAPEIRPIKGQMISFDCPEITLEEILYKNGHYLIPRQNGIILAGSTLEDTGFDQSTTQTALETLTQRSIELLPALARAKVSAHWSGLRPYSESELPIVEAHPEVNGLYLNCGHHRYGVCMAPYSAEKIAKMIFQ